MNQELDWEDLFELAQSGEITHVLCDIFDTALIRKMVTFRAFLMSKYGFWGKCLHSIDRMIRFVSKKITKQDISQNIIGRVYVTIISQILIEDLSNTVTRTTIINYLETLKEYGVEIIFVSNTDFSSLNFVNHFSHTVLEHSKIFTSHDAGVYKSNGLFAKVIEGEGLDLGSLCIVGDSRTEDIEVAKLLGVNHIRVDSYFESIKNFLSSSQLAKLAGSKTNRGFLHSFCDWFNASKLPTNWESIGFIYSYALSSFIWNQLSIQMSNAKETEIIFLSREGYMPWRIASSEPQSSVKNYYLYVSRQLLKSPEGRNHVLRQLQDFRLASCNPVIFDVGWRGKSVGQVRTILNRGGRNYFLAIWPWHRRVVKSTSLFASKYNIRKLFLLRSCPEIYEFVLSAPHRSAVSKFFKPQPIDSIETQMCIGFESALKMHPAAFDHSSVHQLFGDLIRRPSSEQANLFGSIVHSTDGEPSRTLIDPVHPLWIKGALRVGSITKFVLVKEFSRRIASVMKQFGNETTFEK